METNYCGCKIEYPHSHLVAGNSCPCEKGIGANKIEPSALMEHEKQKYAKQKSIILKETKE